MEEFKKTLYYERDHTVSVKIIAKQKNEIKVGDKLIFFGHLFKTISRKTKIAKTRITYNIKHINDCGCIIHIIVEALFNKDSIYGVGKLVFEGTLFSPNFGIKDDKILDYETELCTLAVTNSDKAYDGAYGNSKYVIYGDDRGGKLNINVKIP